MNNTTWHEVGHAVFASIFKDYIQIDHMTILPGEYGKGANLIRIRDGNETELDKFHLVIVCLAGLVVELSTNDRKNIKIMEQIVIYLNNRLKNSISDSFDGDFEILQEPLEDLSKKLNKSKIDILVLGVVYISNCLTKTTEFWPAIDRLTSELHQSKKLSKEQIENSLNSIGFSQYLASGKKGFLSESKRLLFNH